MRIDLADLKLAVKWLEANSPDLVVAVDALDAVKLRLCATDRQGRLVEIALFDSERAQLHPQITQTERLV